MDNDDRQVGRILTRREVLVLEFFFDDTLSDQVFTQQPYASKGVRNTHNSQDNIYQSGGSQLLLNLIQNGSGYTSTFDIGLNI